MKEAKICPQRGQLTGVDTMMKPYAQTALRCIEHHRQRRLVGYCPMCILRQIDDDLQETCYGTRTAESHLIAIRDIIERLRMTQVMAALCTNDVPNA